MLSATLTTLASFNDANAGYPYAGLVEDSGGNLFGATYGGTGCGTVFEIAAHSGVITTLASFNFANGRYTDERLVEDSGGNLFGTTYEGGDYGYGTVFEIAAHSGVITTLASFNGANGAYIRGCLVEDSSGNVFGTAASGGVTNDGTVFEIAAHSGVITVLATFNGANGETPYAGVIEDSSGNLFGTTETGGSSDDGTVFEIAAHSGVITTLASFNGANGQWPHAGVVEDSSGNLFGTTSGGGLSGDGAVFEIAANSGLITTLASFNGANGETPEADLVEDSSGNLFGTTEYGGAAGYGTAFEIQAGSGVVTTLASFNGPNGEHPYGGLVEDSSSGNLFGTTIYGGAAGYNGTVFELSTRTLTTTSVSASQVSATYGTPVTFTATVTAQSGSSAPTAGSVDFYDTTTNTDLGLGTFGSSTGTTSTWTLTTGVKTFNVTTGDTITATYTPSTGFAGSSGTTTESVTPLAISGTITAFNKVYDGGTSATIASRTLAGVLGSDAVSLTGGTATFAGRNVASGVTVTATGLTLTGAQAGDYNLLNPTETTTASITALPITVTAVPDVKIYDGTTHASAVPTTTSGSLVAGDTAVFTESYDTKNAGIFKTLTAAGSINDGNSGNNYAVTFATTTVDAIYPRAITVTAIAFSKTYDGTTGVTALPTISFGTVMPGDVAVWTESFQSKNVPTNWASGATVPIVPTGSVIGDGNGGGNYNVTFQNVGGTITPKYINVNATTNTKPYDGSTSAAATPTLAAGFNLAIGDTPVFTESYLTPNAGTGKTLVPTGSVMDGNNGNNYVVTWFNNTTGAILATQVAGLDVTVNNTAYTATSPAGTGFLLTVEAVDSHGNVASTYSGVVLFLASDGEVPASPVIISAGTGEASVLGILDKAGDWTITASDGTYSGTSNVVDVTPAAAAKLVVSQQLGSTAAGATMSPLTVDVEDLYGNVVTSSTASVAVASSSGTLYGSTTASAVNGVATFSNLDLTKAGSYNLSVSSAGLSGSSSNAFTISATAASELAFTAQPSNTLGASTIAGMAVAVEDQYGNEVTTDTSSVTLSLNAATSGGGGVLYNGATTGSVTVPVTNGVAAFSGLSIVDPSNHSYSAAGTGYSLTATDSSSSVSAVRSAAFNTTLVVNTCTMTATGFVATFSQPIAVSNTGSPGPNLYTAVGSGNFPSNVELQGKTEGMVSGSLLIDPTDTQITFVATTLVNSAGLPIKGVSSTDATSGVLAPDTYTVFLDSGSTAFETINGQLLDGVYLGVGGKQYTYQQTVNNSADVDVVLPSFARGPSSGNRSCNNPIVSTVNVTNDAVRIVATTTSATIAAASSQGATESANTVTIITTTSTSLVVGELVTVCCVGVSGYDGTFYVASVAGNRFTYSDPTSGLGNSGGGTVTSYGGVGLTESGNTVTVTTKLQHGLVAGDPVTISDAGLDVYNGTFTVLSTPSSTTFTYTDSTTGLANSGGGTATLARGIPISLLGPTAGVTAGSFTLTYNPSLLNITGVLADPNAVSNCGEVLTLASNSGGTAVIDFTTSALPNAGSNAILLGGIQATVPSTAYYKSKDLLHFSNVSLNGGSGPVAAVGADALHLVAFPGDANGNGLIDSGDTLDLSRVEAGADTGFAAYQLTDPRIVGDLGNAGTVDGTAVSLDTRYVNSLPTPQVPVYPGAPAHKLSGADPTVSIPSTLQLGADGSVVMPVNIDDAHPAGSTGMTEATLAVTYDPAVLSVSASDIQLGSVPATAGGWSLESTVDAATGQIGVTIWSAAPITSSAAGSLVTIVFHAKNPGAAGTTTVDLVSSVDPEGSGMVYTQVDDAQGPMTLGPAPTDAYDPRIDGTVSLGSAGAVLPQLTTSVVAAPAAPVSAGIARSASGVSQHVADGLFAILGRGAVAPAELSLLGSGGDAAVTQALAEQMSAAGSAQASLDNLLWENGDSSWQDGEREWFQ